MDAALSTRNVHIVAGAIRSFGRNSTRCAPRLAWTHWPRGRTCGPSWGWATFTTVRRKARQAVTLPTLARQLSPFDESPFVTRHSVGDHARSCRPVRRAGDPNSGGVPGSEADKRWAGARGQDAGGRPAQAGPVTTRAKALHPDGMGRAWRAWMQHAGRLACRTTRSQEVSEEDVGQAIRKLSALGGGFAMVSIGGQRFVRSVPGELNQDGNAGARCGGLTMRAAGRAHASRVAHASHDPRSDGGGEAAGVHKRGARACRTRLGQDAGAGCVGGACARWAGVGRRRRPATGAAVLVPCAVCHHAGRRRVRCIAVCVELCTTSTLKSARLDQVDPLCCTRALVRKGPSRCCYG